MTPALDLHGVPLAGIHQIEASAGTGKTWSLCALYLRLLLERGLQVQEILVVTFTNAATAELRERIRARLVQARAHFEGGPGDEFLQALRGRLRDTGAASGSGSDDAPLRRIELALATFDEAAIFTIHGFCQRALADAPFTAGAPLALALSPDDRPWSAQAAADFWRRHVAGNRLAPALAAVLVRHQDTPERYARFLRDHLAKPLASLRWPEGIDRPDALDPAGLDIAHARLRALWPADRAQALAAVRAALGTRLHRNVYTEDAVARAAAGWDVLAAAPGAAGTLGVKLRDDRADLLAAGKLARCTRAGNTPPVHPFFEAAQAWLDARDALAARAGLARMALLERLLVEGERDVRAARRRERVVGFDDLLRDLRERLQGPGGPALAAALAERWPAALIDEFQDTDPQQFAIFESIYRGRPGPMFLIGDPKQAIYSFRNADLHTYLAAGRQAATRGALLHNQRSDAALIGALNTLFGANARAFLLDGLDYHAVQAGSRPRATLHDASRPEGHAAAFQVWMLPDDPETGLPMRYRIAQQAAVDATAGEIRRLLAQARAGRVRIRPTGAACGDADERALEAGDIAVLVRSNAHGSLMRNALLALGIGCVELAQASIHASIDAEEIERVLAAVLEPAQVRLLKSALSTQAMGWSAAAIDTLADDEVDLPAQVQRFAAWRDTWRSRGIAAALRQWMSDDGVAARLLARDDGERRMTNLLHLLEQLHAAADDHRAPAALLRWLQAQRADSAGAAADETRQLRLESSERDLVQIVTVHKAKGLEYGIVFCPLLWAPSVARTGDDLDGWQYHDDATGGLVIDHRRGFLDKGERAEPQGRARRERDAEDLRLVYVALTRAVHRCVLVAGCCIGGAGPGTGSSVHSLLNWLVAGDGVSPEAWPSHPLDVDGVATAWRRLAQASGGSITVEALPQCTAARLPSRHPAPDRLAALEPPRRLPQAWRIGSFSGLLHGPAADVAARTHEGQPLPDGGAQDDGSDAQTPGETPAREHPPGASTPPPADDILRFPRGAAAGICIHEVFERIDYTRPAGWPAAIVAALRAWRTLRSARPDDGDGPDAEGGIAAMHAAMLARMLADVLALPIEVGTATPLVLGTVPPRRRLTELEFHLGPGRLDARALQALLADCRVPAPRLDFPMLQGFLKGYIDAVVEHDGRWFVLDWKSNHLGDGAHAYAAGALATVMRSQAYTLQALLYQLALDRMLRLRLPGYDPRRHLGGAVIVFVRGARPGWRDAQGRHTGVVVEPANLPALARLGAALSPAGAAA